MVPAARQKEKEKEKDDKEEKRPTLSPPGPDPVGRLLGKSATEVARDVLRSPIPEVRRSGVEALEAMGPLAEPAIPELVQALGDSNLFVRWAAARTLGWLAPRSAPQVVPGLVCLLREHDIDVRTAAITALGQYGPAAGSAVPALAQA